MFLLRSRGFLSSCRRLCTHIEKYERKSPIEHVLLRPGMYVGQTNPSPLSTWIFNEKTNCMEKATVTFPPALVKIYDEILVNAADNRWRSQDMSYINIVVEQKFGELTISVKNNGRTIPIEFNEKEQLYIPELIFGHLMTGSNFDDSHGRVTGGMHGYGAKLTNIFSNVFEIEIYDALKQIKYKQTWRDHMTSVSSPEILHLAIDPASPLGLSYTKVTFQPDLKLFHLPPAESMDYSQAIDHLMILFSRRALDLSGSGTSMGKREPIQITFNGNLLSTNSFAKYVQLYGKGETLNLHPEGTKTPQKKPPQYLRINDHWEIGIIPSPTGSFEQMSFVNSVWTSRGGTHVNHITSQCVKYIHDVLLDMDVAPSKISSAKIKNHLMVFVNCLVENPSFDSQGKESLSTKVSQFSNESEIPLTFLKKHFNPKSSFIEMIYQSIQGEKKNELQKTKKGVFGQSSIMVDSLEDAHEAGPTTTRSKCTLIITEGESAKALAVAGLEIVGRELYGVIPIQGKIINALVSKSAIFKNKDIIRLCQAIGLDTSKSYSDGDISSLRYGHLLIMTDQDPDGSHIKGLIINLLNKYWPQLLKIENFIQQLNTPLLKVGGVSLSEVKKTKVHQFYSEQEFDAWKKQIIEQYGAQIVRNMHVKYYKGLGTSTAAEAREYFENLDAHVKNFQYGKDTLDSIDLAFSADRIQDRKSWLRNYESLNLQSVHIPPTQKNILYEDFINKDLIHYSFVDLLRSVPSVFDGLKISQRKILYTCFKQNIRKEVKVVQLSGLATELTAYHHGENSIHHLTIRMAQDFVGSNNLPLLEPCGQFGTRHSGGKDFASPRYIYTRLSPITDLIFPEADMNILDYEIEDGKAVEPTYYLPIIPMLLVNGTLGIGTGWSTKVPHYNPVDIIDHLIQKIRGIAPSFQLMPWLRGFKGEIQPTTKGYITTGIVERKSKTLVEISELPGYKWTEEYKESLFNILQKNKVTVTGFKENHSVGSVKFQLYCRGADLDRLEKSKEKLLGKLGLRSVLTTDNMHAFDENMKLQQYYSAEEIINAYFPVRLNGYIKRREKQLKVLRAEELRLRNQSKFITEIYAGKIELMQSGRPLSTEVMSQILESRGYSKQSEIDHILSPNGSKNTEREEYLYLLDLPIRSLTAERAQALQARAEQAQKNLEILLKLSAEAIWVGELQTLKEQLIKIDPSYNRSWKKLLECQK